MPLRHLGRRPVRVDRGRRGLGARSALRPRDPGQRGHARPRRPGRAASLPGHGGFRPQPLPEGGHGRGRHRARPRRAPVPALRCAPLGQRHRRLRLLRPPDARDRPLQGPPLLPHERREREGRVGADLVRDRPQGGAWARGHLARRGGRRAVAESRRAGLHRQRRPARASGSRERARDRHVRDRRGSDLRRGPRSRQARARARGRLVPVAHRRLLEPLGEQGRDDRRPPARSAHPPLQAVDPDHPHAGRQSGRDHRRQRLGRPAVQPGHVLLSLAPRRRARGARARPRGLWRGDPAVLLPVRRADDPRRIPAPQVQPGRIARLVVARLVDAGRPARAADPGGRDRPADLGALAALRPRPRHRIRSSAVPEAGSHGRRLHVELPRAADEAARAVVRSLGGAPRDPRVHDGGGVGRVVRRTRFRRGVRPA